MLKFLAEKTLSGEADHLKEYSIGIDAFGKSAATYDPKHDSHVRIQVGRLRQKLVKYYDTEGKGDSLVIEVPKGRFRLAWHPNAPDQLASAGDLVAMTSRMSSRRIWRRVAQMTMIALMIAMAASVWYLSVQLKQERQFSGVLHADWTPELEQLWKPFLSARPLLISLSAPMFVDIPGVGFFRARAVNTESEAHNSRQVAAVQKVLRSSGLKPENRWTLLAETKAAFVLTSLLAARKPNISVVGTRDLAWQQLSENNVLFVGISKLFNEQLRSMPAKPQFEFENETLRNFYPEPGEQSLFQNQVSSDGTGVVYALVTHTPGPLGSGDVEGFLSLVSAGRLAAVHYFTEPATAGVIVRKMRRPSGAIPRYYDVVLKIRLEHYVPMETSYVLHRELRTPEN